MNTLSTRHEEPPTSSEHTVNSSGPLTSAAQHHGK